MEKDPSGALLVKIANRIEDAAVAEKALKTFFDSRENPPERNSPDDIFLRRVYFEGEREKLAADVAAEIDRELGVYEALHGMRNDVTLRPRMEKQAEALAELLPQVKIASEEDLSRAGTDFEQQYLNLSVDERLTFSRNFLKTAAALRQPVPDSVALYAGAPNIELRDDAREQMAFRKAAALRLGKEGQEYADIAQVLPEVRTVDQMHKLAGALHAVDTRYGFDDRRYDRRMPDAWHALLQVKRAEVVQPDDAEKKDSVQDMDKAKIISRFGEGILDEVEDMDGGINYQRLEEIVRMFGGDAVDDSNSK